MKLGAMQPYFFPYIGYFELLYRIDTWVVFDVVKYQPKSWMNRNRILHPNSGWQYINAPVNKKENLSQISFVTLIDKQKAYKRLIAQLDHYKKNAPFYDDVINIIKNTFASTISDKLCDLNIACLETVSEYLLINKNILRCSELSLNFENVNKPGDWAVEISDQLGASEYYNLPGGKEIFNPSTFLNKSIELIILSPSNLTYECKNYEFQQGLSILDVMMWNSPEKILKYFNSRI